MDSSPNYLVSTIFLLGTDINEKSIIYYDLGFERICDHIFHRFYLMVIVIFIHCLSLYVAITMRSLQMQIIFAFICSVSLFVVGFKFFQCVIPIIKFVIRAFDFDNN